MLKTMRKKWPHLFPLNRPRQEKMRDREGDAQSSPWDILISVKLFLDGTKTEVCFPRGPQSQQARVVAILNIHTMPYRQAPMSSYDVMPNTGGPLGKQTSVWWDLKITFVKFTYPGQRPCSPSLSLIFSWPRRDLKLCPFSQKDCVILRHNNRPSLPADMFCWRPRF